MNTLSKQPALGKQQAARLSWQLQQLVVSRRGAALGAILLAGGGYVYIQQLQAQHKARLRYVYIQWISSFKTVLNWVLKICMAEILRWVEDLQYCFSASFGLCMQEA